jgi:hypothetical protein
MSVSSSLLYRDMCVVVAALRIPVLLEPVQGQRRRRAPHGLRAALTRALWACVRWVGHVYMTTAMRVGVLVRRLGVRLVSAFSGVG